MSDCLYDRDAMFRATLNALYSEAGERRRLAKREGNTREHDRWSAVEGHLQYARDRWVV
jgi:hypothetical protein